MRIKKGDNIVVTAGKDRGKKGKVLRAFPREGRVVAEGIRMHKKHVRAKRAGQKGQIVEMPGTISVSSVSIICGKCGKATRVGYAIQGKKKVRICKKCGLELYA